MARSIALCFCDTLNNYPKSFRFLVFEKFLNNPLVKSCILEYLQDLAKNKENHLIVDNFKCGLSDHLKGQKTSPLVMAKDIVRVLAMSNMNCNGR